MHDQAETSLCLHGTLKPMKTELFDALSSADASVPASLETFDAAVGSAPAPPDFYEYSMRVGDAASPYRLTYYFDVHRRGERVAHEAGARFVRLCTELALPLPTALREFVSSSALAGKEVLQAVVGVEAGFERIPTRAKFYLVFQDRPADCVKHLLRAADLTSAVRAEPDKVCIVGVDVTARGWDDVKLYYRLEPGSIASVVEVGPDLAPLVAESREVILQQCTRHAERRQIYFHTRNSEHARRWLEARFGSMTLRARAIEGKLRGSRFEPRILSFPLHRHRIDLRTACGYFHLARI
jgi:hypothetical protein